MHTDYSRLILEHEELKFLGYDSKKMVDFDEDGNIFPKKDTGKLFIIDCEMVMTENGQEAVFVTLIDSYKNILINKHCKPNGKILDYVTHITGYTEKTFENVTTTIDEIVCELRSFVSENDILAGHDVLVDLKSMMSTHSFVKHFNIIDTKMLFPHSDGYPSFNSLKYLADRHLKINIQQNVHNSLEDANAVCDLVNMFMEHKYIKPSYRNFDKCYENPTLDDIIYAIGISQNHVKAIYLKGSRAIGTNGMRGNGKPSDWDFLAVIDDDVPVVSDTIIKCGNIDIALYNYSYFRSMLEDQVVWTHEAIYPPVKVFEQVQKIDFQKIMLDYYGKTPRELWIPYLIASVGEWYSKKISNAKRFIREKNMYGAKKQIFFAFRFINYGLDIAKYQKIIDIKAWNNVWYELMNEQEQDFSKYFLRLDKLYDEFKIATPKLIRHGGYRENLSRLFYSYDKEIMGIKNNANMHVFHNNKLSEFMRTLNKSSDEIIKYMHDKHIVFCERNKKYKNLIKVASSNYSDVHMFAIFDDTTWNVVAYSFDKIDHINSDLLENQKSFNIGKNEEMSIYKMQEKLDGIGMYMFFYANEWHVDTQKISNDSQKYIDLFWKIWNEKKYSNDEANKFMCYTFELMSVENINIVRHTKNDVILIGAINVETFKEQNVKNVAINNNWNYLDYMLICCKLNEIIGSVKKEKHIEGYIFIDNNFNRKKIITKEYVEMKYLNTVCTGSVKKISKVKLLKAIQLNKQEEIKMFFNNLTPEIDEISKMYFEKMRETQEIYDKIKMCENVKSFSEQVKKHTQNKFVSGMLFLMKNTNAHIKTCFGTSKTDNILKHENI
jgi:DNA polymerase III epsilon subunit-like protein